MKEPNKFVCRNCGTITTIDRRKLSGIEKAGQGMAVRSGSNYLIVDYLRDVGEQIKCCGKPDLTYAEKKR